MAENYYALLGVRPEASDKEIAKAYRKRARECHPDVRPDDQAAARRFKEVQRAFEVLRDPQKRAAYDETIKPPYRPKYDANIEKMHVGSPQGCPAGPRLRRFPWGMCIGIGIVAAIGGATVVWFGWGPTYESVAHLRLRPSERATLFLGSDNASLPDPAEFDGYRATQGQVIKNRSVLQEALRSPDVMSLNLDQRERDPVAWLKDQLQVTFPSSGEIMAVSIASPDPQEAQILVQAVVDAHLEQLVGLERCRCRQYLDQLESLREEYGTKIRTRRSECNDLAERLGIDTDPQVLTLKQQAARKRLDGLLRQQMQLESDLRKAKSQLDQQIASINAIEVSEHDVEQYARSDPEVSKVLQELSLQQSSLRSQLPVLANHSAAMKKAQRDLQRVDDEYSGIISQLRVRLLEAKRAQVEKEKLQWEEEVASLLGQSRRLGRDYEEASKQLAHLTTSSASLELAHAEIEELQKRLDTLATERERLQLELDSLLQVILVQKASLPEHPSNTESRVRLAIMTAAIVLCLPMGCVIFVRVVRRLKWRFDRL
jgi:hypothetical protein